MSIKLYSLVSPEMEPLEKIFRDSLKDTWEIHIDRIPTHPGATGDFMSPEWLRISHYKIKNIIEKIKENMGQLLIFSDVDIQFFKPCTPLIEKMMESYDMVFQSERQPFNGEVNTGFITLRATPEILIFWERTAQLIPLRANNHDQDIVNEVLKKEFFPFRWGVFGPEVWAMFHGGLIPPQAVLHHANHTAGKNSIQRKISQLHHIKEIMDAYQGVNRKYLVYCPVGNAAFKPELFGENRLFDVALQNYTGEPLQTPAEYFFAEKGVQKLYGAYHNLKKIQKEYKIYALIDDDLEISTENLNTLFYIGDINNIALYQPALSRDSFGFYPHTFKVEGSFARKTNIVEMMAPFFSKESLGICLPTFTKNLSGWGLDCYLWPQLLKNKLMAIIDIVPMRHTRPLQSKDTILANGKTPLEELRELENELGRPQ